MKKLSLVAIVLAFAVSAFAGDYKDISVKEVRELVDSKKAVIIDVNGTSSYQNGHIPGALNFDAVKADLAGKLPADKDALIVAYCGGPQCTAYRKAADAASELGYKNIRHLVAGISGWKKAEQPVEKN